VRVYSGNAGYRTEWLNGVLSQGFLDVKLLVGTEMVFKRQRISRYEKTGLWVVGTFEDKIIMK